MTLQKPVALITGSSRGIGAAIARRLGREGFHILINYCSQESKALEVVKQITEADGTAETCGFNVSNPEQVQQKIDEIAAKHGSIAVLVNNAGITSDGLLMRMKNEDIDRTFDINLKGAIYCTRAASRHMMKARNGSIIQVSSIIGETGNPGQSIYAATKAGLLGFTKSMARELASRNIRVNAVTPGFIETEMTQALTEAQKEAILRNVPLGFFGLPDDVASVVAFLASPDSRYITGQVLGVNGGMYM